MRRQSTDLIVVVGLAVLAGSFSLLPELTVGVFWRALVGIPAVLLAPGYAITSAVWLEGGGLRQAERLTLSLGLSLALATVGGLILYWTGAGLHAASWSLLLGGVTLIGSLLAAVRRVRRSSAADDDSTLSGPARQPPRWSLSPLAITLLGASGLLTVGAVGLAVAGASQPREEFSQLWLLPSGAANAGEVQVGLRSMEPGPTRFRVEVREADQVALDVATIELSTGQTWQTSLPANPDLMASDSIEALVYRADAPDTPYRRVNLRPPQAPQAPQAPQTPQTPQAPQKG